MLKHVKMGGRNDWEWLGRIYDVQKQQEGVSVLSILFRKLCLYHYPGFFLPHDLNGSRIKKASLKFFIFVVVVAIFSAGCT